MFNQTGINVLPRRDKGSDKPIARPATQKNGPDSDLNRATEMKVWHPNFLIFVS